MESRTFHPARLRGRAVVPPAKSEAHRALLLAALGEGACCLQGLSEPPCDDIQAMAAGVSALGAEVRREEKTLVVTPAPPTPPKGRSFHVEACAAALRMLIPAFWVRGQAVRITMEEALFARPLDDLEALAGQAGVTLKACPAKGGQPAYVELGGQLLAGNYQVAGNVSSQYASGLLIALAHGRDKAGRPAPSTLEVLPPIASRPYLDMTLGQMARFGIPCTEEQEGFFRLAPGSRKNPTDVSIPGDWSQGAVLLCANAMGSAIVVENLTMPNPEALQGDARIVDILRQMGMTAFSGEAGLTAGSPSRAPLCPVAVDCTDIPDLAPILALTCTQAYGASHLTGVKRLKAKECDRLAATAELLGALGAQVEVSADEDRLSIYGPVRLKGGIRADARGDHRMVMLLAMAALIGEAPVTVTGVESVSKSWPGFLEEYQRLGGVLS